MTWYIDEKKLTGNFKKAADFERPKRSSAIVETPLVLGKEAAYSENYDEFGLGEMQIKVCGNDEVLSLVDELKEQEAKNNAGKRPFIKGL